MNAVTKKMSRLWAIPLVVLVLVGVPALIWLLDRSPPLTMVSYEAATAKPGGWLKIRVKVQRDYRRCDLRVTANLFDGEGTRLLLAGEQGYPFEALVEIERISPGTMSAAAYLSPIAVPGQGRVLIAMSARCNPLHVISPIGMAWVVPFQIEAPK